MFLLFLAFTCCNETITPSHNADDNQDKKKKQDLILQICIYVLIGILFVLTLVGWAINPHAFHYSWPKVRRYLWDKWIDSCCCERKTNTYIVTDKHGNSHLEDEYVENSCCCILLFWPFIYPFVLFFVGIGGMIYIIVQCFCLNAGSCFDYSEIEEEREEQYMSFVDGPKQEQNVIININNVQPAPTQQLVQSQDTPYVAPNPPSNMDKNPYNA